MTKKGELTTTQIVALIILITSFLVILYFLFFLNPGDVTDKELCHNSVAMRANTRLPGDSVSLDCKRSYVCITQDGTCEKMSDPEKINVDSKGDVYSALASEMKDCWWMFGEGKLDYVGDDFFVRDNYCSICSQFVLDDSVENIFEGKVSKDDFYDYLAQTKISGEKITYAEYFFGTNNIDLLKDEVSKNQSADVSFGEIDFNTPNYVVMGITSKVKGRWWKIPTAVVAGVVVSYIPGLNWVAGSFAGAIIIGSGEYGALNNPEIGAITVEGESGNNFMAPTIIEANSEKFEALNCYSVETLS